MSIVERALKKAGVRIGPQDAAANRSSRRVVGVAPHAGDVFAGGPGGGHLDLAAMPLRESGLVPPGNTARRLAEELRLIKRPLLLNAEGVDGRLVNGNLVMVGSALPGAGKTFMAFNLALSMASEPDWSVLLVDADLSRRTLSRHFGVADAPGLITLLESDAGGIADHAMKTDRPGLHVLPAGPHRPNVKELIGSQRMRSLIAEFVERDERRIVLFDSPPLLLTSEARVLASYVGQIVLVVEAGVTPRRSLLDTIEILDPSKAINLVLNKDTRRLGIGDYHYAGYEYGSEDEKKVEG